MSVDKGQDREKAKVLNPLTGLMAVAHPQYDCDECLSVVRERIEIITSAYPSLAEMPVDYKVSCPQPLEPKDFESDSIDPTIINSDLFDIEDAELYVLSQKDSNGHRMRYCLHKRIAEASPVMRDKLHSLGDNADQGNTRQTIEIDAQARNIDALLRVLYIQNPSDYPHEEDLRMTGTSAEPFALGYIMLKKLRFEKYIGEVRGVLRWAMRSSCLTMSATDAEWQKIKIDRCFSLLHAVLGRPTFW
jgi:hypothetical protein